MKRVKYVFMVTPLYWLCVCLSVTGLALCHRAVVINTWITGTLQSIAK